MWMKREGCELAAMVAEVPGWCNRLRLLALDPCCTINSYRYREKARSAVTHRPRRPYPKSEERRPDAAATYARRLHGRERVGQVVAGVRHDLRRRAAPVRRVAVGLRPSVPR